MLTRKSKLSIVLVVVLALLFFGLVHASAREIKLKKVSVQVNQENETYKYGQYVYVTLKDGSQTIGKIVGKKNSKKYYVNQLDGAHHGIVHVKYIRRMTKEEIKNYKASRLTSNNK